MDKKIIGYILMGAGVLLSALSYPAIRTMLKVPIPSAIKDIYIIIAGVAAILAGAFFAFKNQSAEQPKEVPIYEGTGKNRKVVAIQRIGKE